MAAKSMRAAFRGAVLLASTSFAASAWAQTQAPLVEGAAPRVTTDANGVDLSSGKFIYAPLSVATGQGLGGQGQRDLTRTRLASRPDGTYSVSIGDDATIFVYSGGTYTPKERSGYTLVSGGAQSFTYTTPTGDVAQFGPVSSDRTFTPNGETPSAPLSVSYANGERYTFNYTTTSWKYCLPGERINGQFCHAGNAPPWRLKYAARLSSITDKIGGRVDITYQQANMDPAYTGVYPESPWWTMSSYAIRSTCPALGNASCSSPITIAVNGTSYTDGAGRTSSASASGVRFPGSASTDIAVVQSSGKVTSATSGGVTTSYAYAESGDTRTVTVTEGSQPARVLQFRISTQQPLSEQWQASIGGVSYTRSYDYTPNTNDPSGTLVKRITEPEGNYTRFTYDIRGNVTETRLVSKTPGTPPDIVTSATYAATCGNVLTCNKPNTTTDARGGVTNYTYDPVHGGVTSVMAPAPNPAQPTVRPETRYSYTQLDANGAASSAGVWTLTGISTCATTTNCVGTADERRTVIAYGAGLRVASKTEMAGNGSLSATTTISYDARGNAVAVDGPLPGPDDTVRTRYDTLNRPIGTVSPDPDGGGPRSATATRITYNVDGTVQSVEQGTDGTPAAAGFGGFTGLQTVTSSYDAYHRKVKEVLTAGGQIWAVSQMNYDPLGRLDCSVTRMDPAQWAGQTDACVPQTSGPNGPDRVVRRSYDGMGRVVSQTSAYNTAAASTEATSYTPNGLSGTVTDALGNVTAIARDGLDRAWRTCFQTASVAACAGSPADYVQTSYASNGDVSSLRQRDGRSFGFGYDGLGRLTSKIVPDGCASVGGNGGAGACPSASATRDVYYAYDLAGRPAAVRFDSGVGADAVTFQYDALDRVQSTTTSMANVSRTLSYAYDAGGRRTRIVHPDGVYFDTGYDALDRATNASWWSPAGGTVPFMTLSYDDLGRRTGTTRASSATGYGYDTAGRLSTLTQSFAGGNGNATTTFTYNPAGQIASATRDNDSYAFTGHYNVDRGYGVNGLNQLTSAGPVALGHDGAGNLVTSGSTTYGYDAENRLVSASNGATLTYDPLGRLWQTAGGAAGVTQFLYDGDHVVAEYDGSNVLKRRYMWGPGADEPIVAVEGAAMTCTGARFLHGDERGSIVAQADCWGNRQAVDAYDEYGIPNAGNAAVGAGGRFGYTGQMWLPELGLWYYKARMYSPTLGRFMQTDPIGYDDGLNWYDYVGGDPVNNTDPSGTSYKPGWPICPLNQMLLHGSCQRRVEVHVGSSVRTGYTYAGQPSTFCTTGSPAPERPGMCWIDDGLTFPFKSTIVGAPPQNEEPKPAPKPKYDPKVNYCGGGDGARFPNAGINDACYRHDVCYDGSGASRLTCDNRFARDILIQCTERTFVPAVCAAYSLLYYGAVRQIGWNFYRDRK